MILNEKAKYYFFLFAKIAIALVAFYFIYEKISIQPWDQIESKYQKIESVDLILLLPIILLSFFNWLAEVYKWKLLSYNFKPLSFSNSFRIVLSSFAASTITPNRVGEYGAKIMFYDKKFWKEVLSYNFLGNMMQLLVTLLMVVSTYYFLPKNILDTLPSIGYYTLIAISVVMFIFLFKKNLKITIPWISKNIELSLWSKIDINSRLKILAISTFRYLLFSIQFLLILSVLEKTNLLSYFSIIALSYLIASFVPTILISDLLIKGSVAIYLFSFVLIDEITIIAVVLLAWMFNFVLPTFIGIYLLFKKKNHS